VIPHFIQQNKVEKKNVGVVSFTRKTIVQIHHKPQLPTLIPTNHVPIVMHMGMMPIIASHFTYNYGKVNYKTLISLMVKVMGKARKGKVQLIKG
jgi:hypothetical protein